MSTMTPITYSDYWLSGFLVVLPDFFYGATAATLPVFSPTAIRDFGECQGWSWVHPTWSEYIDHADADRIAALVMFVMELRVSDRITEHRRVRKHRELGCNSNRQFEQKSSHDLCLIRSLDLVSLTEPLRLTLTHPTVAEHGTWSGARASLTSAVVPYLREQGKAIGVERGKAIGVERGPRVQLWLQPSQRLWLWLPVEARGRPPHVRCRV